MPSQKDPPDICPVCGEEVPPKALACPECGADHNSGWKEDEYEMADIPDDDFDYDEFIQSEFGSSHRPPGIHPVWWIAGIILLLAFLAFILMAGRFRI